MKSPLIYSRDVKGHVRTWQFEIQNDKWRSISGLMNGEKVVSGWTTCTGKNIGKSNETTPMAQADAEAWAEMRKKLDREYRPSIEELDSVPPSPMLAQKFEDQKSITYPVVCQPKLDGIRALISRHGAFSREFQPHYNVQHILEILQPFFTENPETILDGELYNHDLRDDFNEITSIVRKQKVTDEQRAKSKELIQFHIYDFVEPELDYEHRLTYLMADFDLALPLCDEIQFVPSTWCFGNKDLDEMHDAYLEQGYEGQMIRDPKSLYAIGGRPKGLLKRKEFMTEEFDIMGIEEGNGNWAGCAKRILGITKDGVGFGAGLRGNKAFAKKLLENKADYLKQDAQITVRFFGYTPAGSLRIPVVIDFHPNGRKD